MPTTEPFHETQNRRAASQAFGLAVRELRREARLTEPQLAQRLGVELAVQSSIEHGRGSLPLAAVWAYADALGIDPRLLLAVMRRFSG